MLRPERRRERHAGGKSVLSQVDPPTRPQPDERPLDVRERRALAARRGPVHREVQPGEAGARRRVRVPREREERPVVEHVPGDLVPAERREDVLRVPAVEVGDVCAREAELGDVLGERDGVAVVDAFPGQGVEEELIAQKKFFLDFGVGL